MKVLCNFKKLSSVQASNGDFLDWVSSEDHEFDLTKNNEYIVLAISMINGNIFYYLFGDDSTDYPLPYPKILFEIVDKKISSHWNVDTNQDLDDLLKNLSDGEVLSFRPWSNLKSTYYENLIDEDRETLASFRIFKEKILSER